MVTLYHFSDVPGLTVLEPRQCKKADSPRFGLFFAHSVRSLCIWGGRIYIERKCWPEHLYIVTIDPEQVKVWSDGLKGSRRRWYGGDTLLDQVWTQEPIPVDQETTWQAVLDTIGAGFLKVG